MESWRFLLPDSDVPRACLCVYLSTLPAYDRGQLQMGIPIYSYEELVQLHRRLHQLKGIAVQGYQFVMKLSSKKEEVRSFVVYNKDIKTKLNRS